MSSTTTTVTPQQIGKAFVIQYYRILHEHPESLHRFYSSTSTFTHDDPNKTVIGTELIAKRIEELSFKQRQIKIRQVDCHSTVDSSVIVQVCGEISSTPMTNNRTSPIMKRFVQTFVLTPAENCKQKYYVHNDIFQYQDNQINGNEFSPLTPMTTNRIEFFDNTIDEKSPSIMISVTPPITPIVEQTKPKSYRDAIGRKEKPIVTNKTNKQQKKSPKTKTTRGHPQDVNDYYDDSWYYANGEEGYLSTGYTDDQEIFVGNLSAQVTERDIHELFRTYGSLLLVRIGNTGSQIGAANFAFVVCQSIEMAQAIVADHEKFLQSQKIIVQAKKRRPFPHTFRPTYPTAASPTSYQSTGYPIAYYYDSTRRSSNTKTATK